MTIQEALTSLWPVITSLGGGYVGLLIYIRKLMEERIQDKEAQITQLMKERDDFKGLVLRSVLATERVAEAIKAS